MLERLGLVFFALILLGTNACVTSVEPREVATGAVPDPTVTPAPITFPEDDKNHNSRLEWWYYNGHLQSESGKEFGFHFVVFESDDGIGDSNRIAQLGILDVETGEHYETSKVWAVIDTSNDSPLLDRAPPWFMFGSEIPGSSAFSIYGESIGLGLELEATTPVMLHNEIGWLPTEAGATYYYSWPRQQATGTLTLNGEIFNVTGTAWFDHQWGDFFVLGKPAGWQWFAIQLDDGRSLMITQSLGIDGEITESYGTYMSPEGDVGSLKSDTHGITLTETDEWTSPTTGATYPSGWTIEIESLALDITIDPVADDQEVQGGLAAASTYWEGKARVSGTQNGQPISGDAYVELSGYVDPEPIEWMHR
jgi:predicted secreted hydrolase